ncbi:hypothetical protein KO498_01910 [Lentibacter algarum]|uniref:hypothetical protein n=1 Tax=Lentibacter algarum TaxID=576131 RepID=UPI001C067082|nr:hypothetical protein [Lentibacter algarum]MBU2980558.1 hypothetical protein [Lentibacter algarum]
MIPLLMDLSITKAAVRNGEEASVALVLDELAFDTSEPHSAVYTVTPTLASQVEFYQFTVTGLTYAAGGSGELFVLNEVGQVAVFDDKSDGNEANLETLGTQQGVMRDIGVAGDQIVACGANLQAYRRLGPDRWESFGPTDDLLSDYPGNHLESIDGFAADEIYAAGRSGMIWWYDGDQWTPVQCTTNLAFLSVVCGADGSVYVGGQRGVVAKGRKDAFTVYAPDEPKADIWGIQEFDGKIYCAMMRALASWSEDKGLDVVSEAMEIGETFYNLGHGGNVLWSLGAKDVLRYDGQSWSRINEVEVA